MDLGTHVLTEFQLDHYGAELRLLFQNRLKDIIDRKSILHGKTLTNKLAVSG